MLYGNYSGGQLGTDIFTRKMGQIQLQLHSILFTLSSHKK